MVHEQKAVAMISYLTVNVPVVSSFDVFWVFVVCCQIVRVREDVCEAVAGSALIYVVHVA